MVAPSIEYIVSTYQLPERIKQRVLGIAGRDIERLGLTGFDSQYRYVAELVERFQTDYSERHFLRLNPSLSNDDDTPLSEFLVMPNDNEENIFDEALSDARKTVYVRPSGVLYAIPYGGTRRRLFDGNPLAYFRANEENFRGMNRGQLAMRYEQLFQSLYRAGQLEEAIPHKIDTRMPEDKKQKIIEACIVFRGKSSSAARALGIDYQTIQKVWIKSCAYHPSKVRTKSCRITIGEIQRVREKLKEGQSNYTQIARDLGMSYHRVRIICKRLGFERQTKIDTKKGVPIDFTTRILDRIGLRYTGKPVKRSEDGQIAA